MRYIRQHIQTIIEQYNGSIPLTHFLKNYFKMHPKLGSRDRKILSEMTYCWYRCSKALPGSLDFEEKIKACLLICETSVPQVIQFLPAAWQHKSSLDLDTRIGLLDGEYQGFQPDRLLSFVPQLSEGIDDTAWLRSMFGQPRLFLRVRTGKERTESILTEHGIEFHWLNGHCLSLPNGAPADKLLPPDSYVVQDASSQATGEYFRPVAGESWWDCCSGAGGKSLLLKDIEPLVKLTVSDKRSGILHNLSERFRLYHYQLPEQYIADVSDREDLERKLGGRQFDNIICDVPCTGSGTWARTPEQLYFFREEYIGRFAEKQRQIASNVIPYLKKGGRLIYITCSVFREENEEVVRFLLENNALHAETSGLINGIGYKADSMFVAVLGK